MKPLKSAKKPPLFLAPLSLKLVRKSPHCSRSNSSVDSNLLQSRKKRNLSLQKAPEKPANLPVHTRRIKLRRSPKIAHSSSLQAKIQLKDTIDRAASQEIIVKPPQDPGQTAGGLIKWRRGETLGFGSQAEVVKALNVNTGAIFAVKKLFRQSEDIEKEVDILRRLNHPGVIKYLGSETISGTLHIYLQYLSGGSIRNLLDRIGPFPERTAKVFTKQMLVALAYVHAQGIVHRDIKGANLLIDGQGALKLSDFGSSKEYKNREESGFLTAIRGSLAWTAPEVVMQTGYGRKADVWSVGCTVLEMLTGSPPWAQNNDYVEVLIRLAKTQETPSIPSSLSAEAQEFISLCFQRDPVSRPTVEQLLGMKFVDIQEHTLLIHK